jgi:hypothetical protein
MSDFVCPDTTHPRAHRRNGKKTKCGLPIASTWNDAGEVYGSETVDYLCSRCAEPSSLVCGHCGGDAITSARGVFHEDDGSECEDCGFPGSISVSDDGADSQAYWSDSEDPEARCNRAFCDDCKPLPKTSP